MYATCPAHHIFLDLITRIIFGEEHHRIQNGPGAHPASYPMGTRGCDPGVKRPGREADHSPPSSVEVKEWGELYFTPPIRLHGVVLGYKKHRDNFTLPYLTLSYFIVLVIMKLLIMQTSHRSGSNVKEHYL
jgi:hypothetical protein